MGPKDFVHPQLVDIIYNPRWGEMKTVAFASGSGTNFREAVLESKEGDSNFSIDLLLTDKDKKKDSEELIGALNYATEFGIESVALNGFRHCGSWTKAKKSVKGLHAYEKKVQKFNRKLYEKIQEYETQKGFTFDLAVLAGYMRLFKGALLRRFNNRAINVHPAPLDVFTDGERKYIGDNAVYDQLADGRDRTRSTIILLDPETDAGAILVSGPWVKYAGATHVTQGEADKHQSIQKEKSDWPALRFALRAIANGDFGLHRKKFYKDGNPVVVYQGKEMPYQGFEMGE